MTGDSLPQPAETARQLDIPHVDGRIPFRGFSTWYRIYGGPEEAGKLPLVCLHGGPGGSHDSISSLKALATTGRRVIFYDQLGSGRSEIPEPHPDWWTVDLFVEEVANVRRALDLDRIHLLGYSWGGSLAMAYLLTKPQGVASLIVSGGPASFIQFTAESYRLLDLMPPEFGATVRRHEAEGTCDHPDYLAATNAFCERYVLPRHPQPASVEEQVKGTNPEVYLAMNGPKEFEMLGNLRDWDIRDRLGEIDVPTLVTTGRFDIVTDQVAGTVHRGIRGSEWVLFEDSAHMALVDEPERYRAVIAQFLARNEIPPLGILGEIGWEAAKVAVIRAAVELRIIPIVGAGHRHAEDVAKIAGCSLAGIRVLLDALCHLGVLCWADGGFRLSAISREYLDPEGPVDYGEALLATDIRAFDRFTEHVRTGHVDADVSNPGAASIWAAVARADLARWADSARAFRERWASLGVTPSSMPGVRVLDAGCGAAVASLTIALDDPTASITCLDREVVVDVARRTAESMDVTPQASFVPGDVSTLGALDGPFDLVYFGDVFHFLDPGTIGRVLSETRRLLADGGRVVLHEPMRSPGDFTDGYPYLGAVWLFNAASRGGIYTYDQLASMLGEAGFVSPERLRDTQWVHARNASSVT